MIRVLVFLALLALIAFGAAWIADRPGEIVLTWQGYQVQTSVAVGIGIVALAALALSLVWAILRFVFRIPSIVSLANRMRRRNKGFAALSRGMIAAGAGDAARARKAAIEARRHIGEEPLALLLHAQAAQLSGDTSGAEAAFTEMAQRPDMRLLGLRGLHIEAQRRGDNEAAHHFAQLAHASAPLPWSAKAVLEHRAAQADWPAALAAVESHVAAKLIDKPTGERQRAVLETAIARDKEATAPDEALKLARTALRRAPLLVPAVALAARLMRKRGDIRKASKLIESVWPRTLHPDLAALYLDLRAGDSTADRLARARVLARVAPEAPESRMVLARAALAARDFKTARSAMAPLIADGARPTARMCLLMAELEETEHGAAGAVREWLARGSRAPRDAVWMADGVAYDGWAPASPVTGRLDAFVWQKPAEEAGALVDDTAWMPPPEAAAILAAPEQPVPAPEPIKAAVEPASARIEPSAEPVADPSIAASSATLPNAEQAAPAAPDAFVKPQASDTPGPFPAKGVPPMERIRRLS